MLNRNGNWAIPFNIYTLLSTTSSEGVEIFYSSQGGGAKNLHFKISEGFCRRCDVVDRVFSEESLGFLEYVEKNNKYPKGSKFG